MDSINEEIVTKVVKQLEYYFSDYNLIRDLFLKKLLNEDNGWISFETLMKFNRLNQLVDNKKDLLSNVLKSKGFKSDLIEINVSEEKIRRKDEKPLPEINEELIKSLNERTVHVNGFPKETTFEEMKEWSQNYGNTESIQMRYKKEKEFKGCAFVVFSDKSMADQMINESVLKFKDKELMKENKLRYYERKRQFIEQKRKERIEKRAQREENGDPIVKNGRKSSVLKLSNVPKAMSESCIKEYFQKLSSNESKVRYVLKVFSKKSAFVRFDGNSSAADVFDKILSIDENSDQSKAKVVINSIEMNVQMLTEEEEKEFWKRDKNNMKFKEFKNNYNYINKYNIEFFNEREQKRYLKWIDKRIDKLKANPVLVESAVLQINDQINDRKTSPQQLEENFKKYANIVEIVYTIDYVFNIRFQNKNDAKNVLAVTKPVTEEPNDPFSGILDINGIKYKAHVLTGEEEINFWLKSIDRIERQRFERNVVKRQKKWIRRKQKTEEKMDTSTSIPSTSSSTSDSSISRCSIFVIPIHSRFDHSP